MYAAVLYVGMTTLTRGAASFMAYKGPNYLIVPFERIAAGKMINVRR